MTEKYNKCQHHWIRNETGQCVSCGEMMISQTVEARTVKSAPNLAAGSGVYVPDHRNAKTVVVGYDTTYECSRCGIGGTISSGEVFVWPCGNVHRGE